jgi:hypothetical protein
MNKHIEEKKKYCAVQYTVWSKEITISTGTQFTVIAVFLKQMQGRHNYRIISNYSKNVYIENVLSNQH